MAGAGTAAPASAPAPVRFDVFLSHNSADKPTVIELATMLKDRKLRVWLDEWELVPGGSWQPALEEVIATVGSAAVLVGKDGIGRWEEPEMRACLDQCFNRKMPVIPVLLPGASATQELPLFLRQFTWVDLRGGLEEARVDRLEWGITGIKPRRA
jgi:TIR domain-containing protein